MNKLILLRHGQSQWNLENKFTGWKDVPLTEQGVKEAKNAGFLMLNRNINIDLIYTSVLKRAYHTAELAIKQMNLHNLYIENELIMQKDKRLNERDYGDLVGLNKEETANKYGKEQVHKWRRSFSEHPPGGESLEDVVLRVKPYFKEFIEPEIINRKNILIVAHGNSLRAALIHVGLYKAKEISGIELPTGIPFIINYKKGKIVNSNFIS